MLTVVYAATLFLSSGLLFAVQPLVGKLLLPYVGGAPHVWNACMVFFQAALLLGYAVAHGVARLPPLGQVALHVGLSLLGIVALPPQVSAAALGSARPAEDPLPWVLARLVVAVGPPVVVLCATTPLLQRWISTTAHAAGRDPYVLYAASNLGSLVALVGYPVLAEPQLGLDQQGRWWAAGYLGLVALVAACGIAALRGGAGRSAASPRSRDRRPEPLAAARPLRWIALSLVPSSYLLGVTAAVTVDLPATPFLWVVPLALYLGSFVLAFARRPPFSQRAVGRVLPALVLFVVVVHLSGMALPLWLHLPLHLGTFFAAALMCHGALAADRPSPERLTVYYLTLAAGGVLGGAFNALLAPLVFDGIAEYPIALIAACLLRPPARRATTATRRERRLDVALPLAAGASTAILVWTAPRVGLDGQASVLWMFGAPAVLVYALVERPVRFASGIAALVLAGQLHAGPSGRPLHQERTFFGVVRVTVDRRGAFHQLLHGGTVHGRQGRGAEQSVPLSYYHPSGPVGDVFTRLRERTAPARVGVVGLGAGSLCAYAEPDHEWSFYEIDPAVERIARDPRYFTFWRDCRAPRRRVVIGDARLRLSEAPDAAYHLLVLDAFTASAVPVHLLTREALQLYLGKLARGGWVAFHVSSHGVDLADVVAALAADAGLAACLREDLVLTEEERDRGKDPSRWVVLARDPADLRTLLASGWRPLDPAPGARVWTDDFSDVWSVVRWQ
jgi:hypothetical protein